MFFTHAAREPTGAWTESFISLHYLAKSVFIIKRFLEQAHLYKNHIKLKKVEFQFLFDF